MSTTGGLDVNAPGGFLSDGRLGKLLLEGTVAYGGGNPWGIRVDFRSICRVRGKLAKSVPVMLICPPG